MRLIIAGTRTLSPDMGFIWSAIKMLNITHSHGMINEVVSGCAEGVDTEGYHWASHWDIPVKQFRPDWNKHGKAAGPIRNEEMAKYGDVLLLIWDGESKGSANMKSQMKKLKKPVYEILLKKADRQYE